MDFSDALAMLKDGMRVTRTGWNGKGMWLELRYPDKNSKLTLPYIYMNTVDNACVVWSASTSDMLAEDWSIVV